MRVTERERERERGEKTGFDGVAASSVFFISCYNDKI